MANRCQAHAFFEDSATFVRLPMSMSEDDLQIRDPMRLEYVQRWVAPDVSGYGDLLEAVRLNADESMADQPAVMPGGR